MTTVDPQQTDQQLLQRSRDGWLAAHGGDEVVVLDDPETCSDRLAALADGSVDRLALVDVLDQLDVASDVLVSAARVLGPAGRLLVAHRVAGAGSSEPRPRSTPAALLRAVGETFSVGEVAVHDDDLRVVADVGPGGEGNHDALLLSVHDAAEAAWLATATAAYRAAQQRQALEDRLDGLQQAIRGRSIHAKERRRLEAAIQLTVDAASEELSELAYQRDEARWKLASLRVRRWWRLGAAISEARRSKRTLLLLPWTAWRILTGPAVPPALPPPTPKQLTVAVPDEVPVVTGMRPRALAAVTPAAVADLRVASITDTFTSACLDPEVERVAITPGGWREVLEQRPPHLLFVESAWRGNDGSWQYRIGQYDDILSVGHPDLAALTAWCRGRDIPTVFWNKEDPIHFARFRRASTLFDVVLTTDANCIDEYASLHLQSADVIEALPFAAQPVLHHPTGSMGPRDPRPVFAGTYYRDRHEDRKRSLEQLLDAARPFDLVIYDRTHGDDDPSTGFPDRFAPHIAGGVPYAEMVRLYRRHRLFLNTNSVVDSPTMFSRRVFELLACGTPVVSTPSRGLALLLGEVVDIVDDEEAARAAIGRLRDDDGWWRQRSLAGIHAVMSSHTYADRLAQVAGWCGYDVVADRDAGITSLQPRTAMRSPSGVEMTLIATDVARTSDGGATTADGVRPVTLTSSDEVARYRELADLAASSWVLVGDGEADADDLARLATARRYTRADVLGVAADGGPGHRYVERLGTGPALVRRDLVTRSGWSTDPAVLPRLLDDLRSEGALLYAVDVT